MTFNQLVTLAYAHTHWSVLLLGAIAGAICLVAAASRPSGRLAYLAITVLVAVLIQVVGLAGQAVFGNREGAVVSLFYGAYPWYPAASIWVATLMLVGAARSFLSGTISSRHRRNNPNKQ